jgi:hypothetical protein
VGTPFDIDIPQFVEVDLKRKLLSTTKASGENRTTVILNLKRNDGYIFMQGVQSERAFSMVLREPTGFVSIAIAMEGITIGVFGSCTPLKR